MYDSIQIRRDGERLKVTVTEGGTSMVFYPFSVHGDHNNTGSLLGLLWWIDISNGSILRRSVFKHEAHEIYTTVKRKVPQHNVTTLNPQQ